MDKLLMDKLSRKIMSFFFFMEVEFTITWKEEEHERIGRYVERKYLPSWISVAELNQRTNNWGFEQVRKLDLFDKRALWKGVPIID